MSCSSPARSTAVPFGALPDAGLAPGGRRSAAVVGSIPDIPDPAPEPGPIIPDPNPNPEPAPIIPDPNPNPDPAPIIPEPNPIPAPDPIPGPGPMPEPTMGARVTGTFCPHIVGEHVRQHRG